MHHEGTQEDALGGLSGLAGDAAGLVLAVPASSPEKRAALALRLLEAGRAVLFSQALEVRGNLTDLTDQYPELAARFTRLRDLLDRTSDIAIPVPGDPAGDADAKASRSAQDRRQLARDLADTLADIRAKEGFGSFARPPAAAELRQQAADGPVVTFNISRYRSDALILTEESITTLPLPGLSMNTVISQVNAFHQAVDSAALGDTARERAAAQRQLSQILAWLWDTAADPVLETLGYSARPALRPSWPRIWWATGGLMGLLPIHAAGHHGDPDDPRGRAVIDRVVSSYTPTIGALRHARRPATLADSQEATPPALIVAMPTTPSLPYGGELRFLPEEVRILNSRLPGSVALIEPEVADRDATATAASGQETAPTRANVLTHQAVCPIAHFACHGVNDPADPARSRLLLEYHSQAPLTVSALGSLHLNHARLAYLSAYDTALSASTQLIDEAIHLASGFQLAGYPHVIGTLWAIDDRIAVTIADAFYAAFINESSSAATARHEAVRAARTDLCATPSLWASHIHVGA